MTARRSITPGTYQGRGQLLAEALQRSQSEQQQGPQDIGAQLGQALNQVGTAYMAGSNERQGEAMRAGSRDRFKAVLAAKLAGQPLPPDAADLLSDEWADPSQQQFVGGLIQQDLAPANDDLVQAVGDDGQLHWVHKAEAAGMQSALPKGDEWEIKTFRKDNQDVTAWVNKNTQETRPIAEGAAFAPQQSGNPKTSLVPFYAQSPDGKIHMFQPTETGQAIEVQLPEGMEPTKPLSFQDLGTSVVGLNPLGGGAQVALPKDVAGAASQTAQGKLQGEAAVDLPSVRQNAQFIKETINRIKNHPGRVAATGGSSVLNPVAMPGGDRQDFLSQAKQLQGQAFLQAYQSLKGGGQITEVEGAKAEAAKVALDTAQSETQYLQALDNFAREVDALVAIAEQKAGSAPSPVAPAGAPTAPAGPNIVQDLPPGFQ